MPVASALYAPTTQAVHTKDVVATASLPYRPAVQAVHANEVVASARFE